MVLEKKQRIGMIVMCCFVYMISYMTRINYGAVISEIEGATQISKSALSLAITGSSITYGAGQIISGICGDRFSPKKLILYGLFLTTAMNFLLPLCTSTWQMVAVWSVNGFAQAFMWPPMVKLLVYHLSDDEYKKSIVFVSAGSSAGTMIIYLLSPLVIKAFGWKGIFPICAFLAIIMMMVWQIGCTDAEKKPRAAAPEQKEASRRGSNLITPLFVGIMIAIVLQGMIRDGVTTWMPSYISETYDISNLIAILTGAILPVFSVICYYITSFLQRKVIRNPLVCAALMFGIGFVSSILISLFSGSSFAVSVISTAVLIGSVHGVNLMLTGMVPPLFAKSGNVSTASGVLNCCTYIGSAVYTYGMTVITEKGGWGVTVLTWLGITGLGTLLCVACGIALGKKLKKEKAEEESAASAV